ncbi:AI-2E family transporter [Zooshikella ganghwensis]|uniref:AI-2E family transporter n=1 Tax=Zooshikella ganghwensis TaxID=202772 RepID=UPI000421900D|nr:AI-2E family transporter [Zooshikella ganghwensis]
MMTYTQRWFLLSMLVLIGILIYLLKPILSPFLVGMILAYLGDPIADRLEAKGMSRTLAVITVFIVLSLVFGILLLIFIPLLAGQIKTLIHQLPIWAAWLEENAFPWVYQHLGIDPESLKVNNVTRHIVSKWQTAGNLLTPILKSATDSGVAIITALTNLFLIPVVTFYLLRDWDVMTAKVGSLLPRNLEPVVAKLALECDEVLGAFLKGQLVVMLCLGIIYAAGLWLVGLQFAIIIGLTAGLASIVPYMGFIVGIGIALVAAVFQFDTWLPFVGVVVVFLVGQALEGMVLTPLLVGDRIGLHPVAVIFAILAGGQLFGFVGVLLALPIAAVIMVLLRHLKDIYTLSALYHANQQPITPDE